MELKKKLLITGVTGFIGKNFLRLIINRDYDIHVLVRPDTNSKRYADFEKSVTIHEIDLTDIKKLKLFLSKNSFDTIVHIGALRGGRKFSKEDYYKANVEASEQLMYNALEHNSKFIFCSSVGVFGAIPKELPASNMTEKQDDNYYHFTKIKSEQILQNLVMKGLNGIVLRPAITYGPGDYGFPYTLTKLIDKKMLFLPDRNFKIHMTNVHLMAESFVKAIDIDLKPGSEYNIADRKPVEFYEIVNAISKKIHGHEYPKSRYIKQEYFTFFEKIARFMKSELWIARFELISKSWYFDVENSYRDLKLNSGKTTNDFMSVVDWYKK